MNDQTKYPFFFFLFSILIVAYLLMYGPFLFVPFVMPALRIGLELLILMIFMVLWLLKSRPGFIPVSFLIFILLAFWLFNAGSALQTSEAGETGFPGFIPKIALLVLGVNALQYYPSLVKFLARAWALLWAVICIQILLAAVGYHLGLVDFPLKVSDWSSYNIYFFNPIFGYLFSKGSVPRFSGYVMEPIFLGLFLGLNILSASYFVSKRYVKKFRILNLIAGILSMSFTFYLFFGSLAAYTFVKKCLSQNNRAVSFFALAAAGALTSWIVLFKMGLGKSSSLVDRVWRFYIGLNALLHSTTHALWFGNFDYVQAVNADRAASCGLLVLLLQKGLILFFPILYLFYRHAKRDFLVLAYLFYYSIWLEYFWWPSFIVYLVLFHCLSNKPQPALQPQGSRLRPQMPVPVVTPG